MKTPLVSILIPVYNVEKYLPRCLDSLLNQTLTDIEIICVNDGSTDDSLKLLKQYQVQDNRIIIVDKKNGGLPSARNAGLDRARGEYVGFVDSDDYVEPSMFETLYKTAQKKNSEVVICGAQIFPETPRASDWLYHCLSPEYRHYDVFEPSLLFQNPSTTPFLWRVFIKRSLIERYHLRLDETILLGEDKAFQAKVYPRAKGITVIPDKLYHYCWFREDSMMGQEVYHISGKKAKAHCRLVEHIAELILEQKGKESGGEVEKDSVKKDSGNRPLVSQHSDELERQFLAWSIPFVYSDFIYLTLQEKTELAPGLIRAWTECGYYRHNRSLEGWIRENYQYVDEICKEQPENVVLSVVLAVGVRAEYIRESLKSILGQSVKGMEVILVNNGASNETYSVLHKALFSDKRIRLYNMERKAYGEALNAGIQLAAGEYLAFCDTDGWYNDKTALEKWFAFAKEKKTDLCASISRVRDGKLFSAPKGTLQVTGPVRERDYYECDFHNILFRTAFIREQSLKFEDCSIFTGFIFTWMSLMKSSVRAFYAGLTYIQRRLHRPDWISTEKCEKALAALAEVMKMSKELQDAEAHAEILYIINGDYYKNILINNTRAYAMPEKECPNGENSQIKTVESLYEIMKSVDPKLLAKGDYDLGQPYTVILCELIAERHKFLADLSNRYHD